MTSQAIVLIPGIKGTKLVNTNRASHDVIWSGLQSEFETIQDLELTERLEGAHYDQERDVIIKPGEIEGLAYGEFLRDLRTDKPIYIFHYDWRLSAVESGERLAEFLEYLIDKSRAAGWTKPIERFDFVTHSLGNFVLRAFLNEYESDLVNKVVFTVPPFKGALDIVVTTLVGEGLFSRTKAKMRKLIRTLPGALELLPTYPGSALFTSGRREVDFFNVNHWQENITDTGVEDAKKKALAQKFRKTLSVAADTVQNHILDLSSLPAPLRGRMLIIARDGYKTLQSVDVVRNPPDPPRNMVDLAEARHGKEGDGAVPHASSCCYHADILTLMITDAWFYQEHSHGFVMNDERVQRLAGRFLSSGPFDYHTPGSGVKRVVGLEPINGDQAQGWRPILQ